MTSWWARWRLKSSASRLFTQEFIHVQIKEKHQSSASLAFVRNSPVTGEFPEQRANNAENVSARWRHHCFVLFRWEYMPVPAASVCWCRCHMLAILPRTIMAAIHRYFVSKRWSASRHPHGLHAWHGSIGVLWCEHEIASWRKKHHTTDITMVMVDYANSVMCRTGCKKSCTGSVISFNFMNSHPYCTNCA